MPDDEDDAGAYQLVRCGDRLIRVAEVVRHDELDLLVEEAAFAVDIRGRHPGAALELLAEPRLRAGHWAGNANQDLSPRGRSPACRSQHDSDSEQPLEDHQPSTR